MRKEERGELEVVSFQGWSLVGTYLPTYLQFSERLAGPAK